MRFSVMALLVGAALCANTVAAQNIVSVIVVNDAGDIGGNAKKCTLREAVENVNFATKMGVNSCAAGAKTSTEEATLIEMSMLLKPALLTQGQIVLWDNDAVVRNGTIDATGSGRLFVATNDTRLFLERMNLKNGVVSGSNSRGGAIYVDSTASLTLSDSVLSDHTAGYAGGAVYFGSTGALAVEGTHLAFNKAKFGAGIDVDGNAQTVLISNSRFTANQAEHSAGALYLGESSPTEIADSVFEFNSAGHMGGAASLFSPTAIRRTNFEGNLVFGKFANGGGGALMLGAGKFLDAEHSRIEDSRFVGNMATGPEGSSMDGGAIMTFQQMRIDGASFSGNYAGRSGGAMRFVGNSSVVLQNSTFAGNSIGSGSGSALAIHLWNHPWWLDAQLPLGGEFPFELVNNSFYENAGGAQVDLGADSNAGPMLFINNILHSSASTPGCSGDLAKWLMKRPNDNSSAVPNVQWPGTSCGVDVPTRDNTLGADAVGGAFGQAYRPTVLQEPGDLASCGFVGNVDQFDSQRACLMGAVERVAPPVFIPYTP